MLILFEGGEGVGKSTTAKRLFNHMQSAQEPILLLREPGVKPGDGSVGEAIRSILLDPKCRDMEPLCEFFLFQASRAQFVRQQLMPALAAKQTVILERFALSTMVYQIAARGLPLAPCLSAIELATEGLVPDITFVLTCSYERSHARVAQRGGMDRIEREPPEFHRKVLEAYESFSRILPYWNIHTIHTDTLPEEDVFQKVLGVLCAEHGVVR